MGVYYYIILIEKLNFECCCLCSRNMDPTNKWRDSRKCIWNMELEKNVKYKIDKQNNEWWSFSEGEIRKDYF